MAEGGISDEEWLKRLSSIYTDANLAGVAKELAEARKAGLVKRVADIHARDVCERGVCGGPLSILRRTKRRSPAHARKWHTSRRHPVDDEGSAGGNHLANRQIATQKMVVPLRRFWRILASTFDKPRPGGQFRAANISHPPSWPTI